MQVMIMCALFIYNYIRDPVSIYKCASNESVKDERTIFLLNLNACYLLLCS